MLVHANAADGVEELGELVPQLGEWPVGDFYFQLFPRSLMMRRFDGGDFFLNDNANSKSEGTGRGQVQMVAGSFKLTGAGEGGFFHEVLEIAGGGRTGGTRDANVFLGV